MWRLLDLLFPPRADEETLRGVSTDSLLSLIAPRLIAYTHPGTVALLPFHHVSVRAALHEAKYHGSTRAFELLGTVLAEYLRYSDELTQKTVIVPVPLSMGRAKERGFNQVESILTYSKLEVTVDPELLVRTRETVSQVSLPRDRRRENMRGAFAATRRADPACTYIVVDDVITTGATLQAAVDALQAAGAENIIPLALAH